MRRDSATKNIAKNVVKNIAKNTHSDEPFSSLRVARDQWRISLSAKIIAPMIALICLFTISTLYSTQRLNETLSELSAVRSSLSSLPFPAP